MQQIATQFTILLVIFKQKLHKIISDTVIKNQNYTSPNSVLCVKS